MDAYITFVAIVFGLWLTGSIVVQIRTARVQALRRFDIFSLLPQYNFFAPTPGTKDFHLLYRFQTADDAFGPWREVTRPPYRSWTNCLWNPGRRERKALFDLVTTLAKEIRQCSDTGIQVSLPYLVFLNHLSHLLPGAEGLRVQFMVMLSHGSLSQEEPRPLFLSQIHRV